MSSVFLSNETTTFSLRIIRICRGCLATDALLYDMRQNRLMEAYSTLLSPEIQLNISDDNPHYLCNYCAALLLKCDAFRKKCIDSVFLFGKALLECQNLTTGHRSTNFVRSEFEIIDIVPNSVNSDVDYVDTTLTQELKASDITVDTDIASDSDESIDFDANEIIESNSSVSDDKMSINSLINNLQNKFNFNSGDKRPLLKDFKVNLDAIGKKALSNSRTHRMNQLYEIVRCIQYSSDTTTELLRIFDTDCMDLLKKKANTSASGNDKVKQKPISNVNKTTTDKLKEISLKDDVVETKDVATSLVQVKFEPEINDNDNSCLDISKDTVETSNEIVKTIKYEADSDSSTVEEELTVAEVKNKIKRKVNYSNAKGNKDYKCLISTILNGNKTKKENFAEEYYGKFNIKVKYLSKEEQIKEIEDRKESDNYKQLNFKCNLCYKGFNLEETFKNHMLLHNDISGKFVCDICQCHFTTKYRLQIHQMSHKRMFTCIECGHATKHGNQAIQHGKWHTGNKNSCKVCGKELRNKSSLYGHIKMCHPTSEQLVRCEICGDSFNGLAGLRFHDNRSHKEMYSPECHCSVCETQFYCSDAFKAHRGTDRVCDTTHKYCVRCGVSFDTEELLKEHEMEQRKLQNIFTCHVCHKVFDLFHKLKNHQRLHFGIRLKSAKKNVVKKFSKETVCEVCGKLFMNGGLLKLHYNLVHTSEKPFKCTFCPKDFKTSALLVGHVRVHTGERPYQCHSCPKAFQNNQNLRRHNIVHTGERPHSCDLCGKSFQSKDSVKLHIKTVHMKIPMPPRIRRRNKKSE